MSIKQIEESPGKDKRSYLTGHTFKCFGCQKWVRWLDDCELCSHCMKQRGIKKTIDHMRTQDMIQANNIE